MLEAALMAKDLVDRAGADKSPALIIDHVKLPREVFELQIRKAGSIGRFGQIQYLDRVFRVEFSDRTSSHPTHFATAIDQSCYFTGRRRAFRRAWGWRFCRRFDHERLALRDARIPA